MANEVQISLQPAQTYYFLIRNTVGQIWNGSAFEAYVTANYANYDLALVEQGTASAYYTGSFPATIVPGVYNITVKRQAGGSPDELDATVGAGDFNWNGTTVMPLSDAATSGQVGQFLPSRIFRGQMVRNFMFPLVGNADHVTPFTSGVISGQISRDGASFTALQSGAFTEVGLGFYNLQALTSGDLLANTVALVFTGVNLSGGQSDPCKFSMVLQRSSGQAG